MDVAGSNLATLAQAATAQYATSACAKVIFILIGGDGRSVFKRWGTLTPTRVQKARRLLDVAKL